MSSKTQIKRSIFGIAIFAALVLAPIAKADFQPTGYAAGSQQFGLSIGGSPNAGGFSGLWNGSPITFWCIELTQYFSFGSHYTYGVSQPNNATFTLLGKLFTEAYGMALLDSTHSAAFQLAIWEIVYDSGSLQLGSGAFSVLNNYGHPATVSLAQTWLNGLAATSNSYTLYQLSNATHQDFITASRVPVPIGGGNVPEPAPIALLLAALLAAFAVSRSIAAGKGTANRP